MARCLAILLILLVLAVPPAALAQGDNPFGPLPPAAPTATPTPTATATPDTGTTGRNTLFVIAGALIVAFAVMGVWIARDARSARGVEERPRLREQGPHRRPRQAKAKARAKIRAQKAARRRNR